MLYIYPIKGIIFIGLLFSFSLSGFSYTISEDEQRELDSLNQVVDSDASSDSLKVETLFKIAEHFYYRDIDTTILICTRAKDIAEAGGYGRGVGESYGWLGYLASAKGDTDMAFQYNADYLESSIRYKDKKQAGTALTNIGALYRSIGNIEKAIEYFHHSTSVYEDLGDSSMLGQSLISLATVYSEQGQFETAIETYNESIEMLKGTDNLMALATAYNNIGYNYASIKKYRRAIEFYDLSAETHISYGNYSSAAHGINNIAETLIELEEFDSALTYAIRAKDIRLEYNDVNGLAGSEYVLAKLNYEKGNYTQAEQHGEKSMEYSEQLGYPRLIESAALMLSKIYAKTSKSQEVYEMHTLYIKMRDSINNVATQTATAQQQAKLEYEKKKAIDDAEAEKKIAVEKEAKEKQKVISYATAGGLILIGLFLLYVFNRLRHTKKQKAIIEDQKEQVEMAHTQLELKNEEIIDSITYAKRIQSAILPPDDFFNQNLPDSFVLYIPKDIVAGDFYWMEPTANDGLFFAAADCTGHGVPGAMVSVVCNNALNRAVREFKLSDPGKILDKVREIVIDEFGRSKEEVKDGMDIALCRLQDQKLHFSGAHNPLWIIRNGELIEYRANKQPVGAFDKAEPFTTHLIDLIPGDTIYIFSDGYADQFGGEKGKKLKSKSLKKLVLDIHQENLSSQKETLENAFNEWKGDFEQLDDVCVIGVRI